MRYHRPQLLFLLALIFIFSGCMLFDPERMMHAEKALPLPAHNEVLRFPLSYDLTFLRTMEAIESVPDWQIEQTTKEAGVIQARNKNFSRLDDADQRVVIFQIIRLSRHQTSVQIVPESQRVIGAGDLMKQISEYLRREL